MPRLRNELIFGSVVVLALITGCGGTDYEMAGGDVTPSAETASGEIPVGDDPVAETSTSGPLEPPPVEPSGPEVPASRAPSKPSISLASVPIGGQSQNDGEPQQCVEVSYLGNVDIPEGVEISVTGASFKPRVFETGGDACSGEAPLCLDGGVTYTADSTGPCLIPIRFVGTESVDNARLSVSGRVKCPVGQAEKCRDLAAQLREDRQTISGLYADAPETTEPTETSDETETSETTDTSATTETSEETETTETTGSSDSSGSTTDTGSSQG
jgi:hypothetical protein